MRCTGWLKPKEAGSNSSGSIISSSNTSLIPQHNSTADSFDSVDEIVTAECTFDQLYSLENLIGYGSYAKVYRCVDRMTQENFAVKVIEEKLLSNYQRQLIFNEEGILRNLNQKNVIKLVAVFSDQESVKRMVFEFADQLDVCLALVTDPKFGELSIKGIVHQLFDGLNYLHQERIIHRDLKVENLLVKSDSLSGRKMLKICDFGYAVTLEPGQTQFTLKNTIIGSFEYMSPELISSQEYSAKMDCWAAGVIVYFLFTGDFPFKGNTVTEMARSIMKRQFTLSFASPEWAAASLNAIDFIKSILEPLYTRPTTQQLLRHAWFTDSPNERANKPPVDLPLPIMRQRERLEFLQHEAEVKLKRLYNNSSSDKSLFLAAISCWSTGIAMRRHRNRYWKGSHETATPREFLVNRAILLRKRSNSYSGAG